MTLLSCPTGCNKWIAAFNSGSSKVMSHNRQLHFLSFYRFDCHEWPWLPLTITVSCSSAVVMGCGEDSFVHVNIQPRQSPRSLPLRSLYAFPELSSLVSPSPSSSSLAISYTPPTSLCYPSRSIRDPRPRRFLATFQSLLARLRSLS